MQQYKVIRRLIRIIIESRHLTLVSQTARFSRRDRTPNVVVDRERSAAKPGQENYHHRSQDVDASVRHVAAPV
jgi:hypothetical protein